MSDKGIFLDILPRFDMAAAVAIINKVQGMFSKAGKEAGIAFGKDASAGLKALQSEVIALENAESKLFIAMERANSQVQIAEARMRQYGGVVDSATASSLSYTKAVAAQNDAVRVQTALQTQHAKAVEATNAQSAIYDARAAQMVGGTSKISASMNSLGMIATGVTALIGVESGKAAGNYEAALTKIQVATGETADQIKALGDGLLKLAPEVGFSAQELTKAGYVVSKAGFKDAADQLTIIKAAAQLARAEGADLGVVMDGLTTTLNDFHVPASKAADAASQLQVTMGASKVPVEQFMGALHNFEPLMKLIADRGLDASTAIAQTGAALAQMTQNGTSADQASQNLSNTLLHLIDPNTPQRNMLSQLGLNPDQLSKDLSGPDGVLGVMKHVVDQIASQQNDAGNVVIGTMFKNQQATDDLADKYSKLTGKSKELADQLNNGVSPAMKDLHAQKELDPMLAQWDGARKKVEGFSDTLNKNKDLVQTYDQVLKAVGGTDQTMKVFAQLYGDPEAAAATQKIADDAMKAHADSNGNVEGAAEVQKTLNFQLEASKAAFKSLVIEIGQGFLPVLKLLVTAMKDVAQFLAEHKKLAEVLVGSIAGIAAAWVTVKTAMFMGTVLSEIGDGFALLFDKIIATQDGIVRKVLTSNDLMAGSYKTAAVEAEAAVEESAVAQAESQTKVTAAAGEANAALGSQRGAAARDGAAVVETTAAEEVEAEGRVATSAAEANAAIAGGAGAAGAAGAGLLAGGAMAAIPLAMFGTNPDQKDMRDLIPADRQKDWDAAVKNNDFAAQRRIADGHAAGGPIVGPGSKGKDSVLMWGAPGEHVLTADEVDALGGHQAVYALRAAARGQIQGYEDGGAPGGSPGYGNMSTLSQWLSQFQGGKYNNATGDDCSGIASQIINVAMGLPNNASRMTTRNAGAWLSARGFQTGYKGVGAINIGWYNRGPNTQDGHMAVTLPDGVHAEMGGGHGFLLGPGAAGAESGQFDHHMYLPISGFVGAPTAGGGSSGTSGSPYSNGGSVGGSGGSGGGSGGAGGSGDQGVGMSYDPMSQLSGGFTLQNIAKFATMMLANAALGNPVGRMAVARNSRGAMGGIMGGGSAVDVDSMITDLPDTADIPFDKAVMRAQTAKANAEKQVGKYGPDSPQGIKALNAYKSALESVQAADERRDKALDSQATKTSTLSDKLQVLNEKLAEQTSSPKTKQSTIDSTLNQIDQTKTKLEKLPAAAKSAAADTSSYFNDAVNGLVPLSDFIGGGGQGPVFKRNGGGGSTTDIAPKDTGGTVRDTPPMSRSSLDKLHDSPHMGTLPDVPPGQLNSRSTATVGGGGSYGGYLPVAGKGQDRDPVGAARRGKPGSTVGGVGSFDKTGPVIGDAAYAGMRDSKTPPPDASGLKNLGIAPPMGSDPATMSAYKQAQANALRGAFAPAAPAAPALGGGPASGGVSGARGGRGGNPLGGNAAVGGGLMPGAGPGTLGGGAATHGVGGGMAPAPASYGTGGGGPAKDSSKQMTGGSGSGFGISGGILGTAESAISSAIKAGATVGGAEAGGPIAGLAAGQAADIATQELNRAVGFAGQVAGIAVDGLLETFGLSGSPIADPGKSLLGKIAGGFAGAHPVSANSAGATAPPLKPDESKSKDQGNKPSDPQQGTAPLVQINEMHNHQADGQAVGKDISRQLMAAAPNGR